MYTALAVAQGQELFDKATKAYNEGEYQQAIEQYEKILENGQHSAAVYYNLANSYYKLNEIAPSIYYYEKALLLDPDDPEIENNLAYARNMTLDVFDEIPASAMNRIFGNFTAALTFDQWAVLAVVFMMLFVAGYIAFYFLRYSGHKRLAFILSMLALLFSIASLIFGLLQYSRYEDDRPAIIFAEEVEVQSEPNQRSSTTFRLHEGTKVQVLEELNDWKKIETPDGQIGWTEGGDLKEVKDF